MEREFRVLEALGRAGGKVPAPKVLVLCGDRRVLGTEFYVSGLWGESGRGDWDGRLGWGMNAN